MWNPFRRKSALVINVVNYHDNFITTSRFNKHEAQEFYNQLNNWLYKYQHKMLDYNDAFLESIGEARAHLRSASFEELEAFDLEDFLSEKTFLDYDIRGLRLFVDRFEELRESGSVTISVKQHGKGGKIRSNSSAEVGYHLPDDVVSWIARIGKGT